jgi:hypothetical protein
MPPFRKESFIAAVPRGMADMNLHDHQQIFSAMSRNILGTDEFPANSFLASPARRCRVMTNIIPALTAMSRC